ncbi:MAG TPA: glycoside hydrolase family 3 N-terminal domain-containing protein, partial [Planctomycetota bacterium]|nr:glycoside hydrolase family 3 N-terminal domain-containing protein [Planctomycetota bacterium]
IRQAVAGDGVGGILLFGGDLDLTPRFLRRLREAAEHPLLVMSDVERGVGQQIEGCLRHPPPMAIGALRDASAAYALGAATALECRRAGIDMALAPVLDLYNEPRNPIVGPRSFGEDPELVSLLGVAWIEGCQEEGVLACAKHFPGHGRTLADSHDALPRVDASAKELRTRDIVPFARAAAAGVAAVMTAHVAYPALDPDSSPDTPATLSRRILGGILRDELGFQGLVMSDALIMEGVRRRGGEGEAAVEALVAGCDVLLCPTDHREIVKAVVGAVEANRVAEWVVDAANERMEQACHALRRRVAARELGGMDEYRAYAMAKSSVTVLRDPSGLLPLRPLGADEVLAVVLDDDDRPGREAAAAERREEFGRGFLRRTPKSAETSELLARAVLAERILLLCYGDTRAWKGRPGLAPELEAIVRAVEGKAAERTLVIAFGGPGLVPDTGKSAAVCAWDDAPLVQRAALDLLLSGRAPTGRIPYGPDPLA